MRFPIFKITKKAYPDDDQQLEQSTTKAYQPIGEYKEHAPQSDVSFVGGGYQQQSPGQESGSYYQYAGEGPPTSIEQMGAGFAGAYMYGDSVSGIEQGFMQGQVNMFTSSASGGHQNSHQQQQQLQQPQSAYHQPSHSPQPQYVTSIGQPQQLRRSQPSVYHPLDSQNITSGSPISSSYPPQSSTLDQQAKPPTPSFLSHSSIGSHLPLSPPVVHQSPIHQPAYILPTNSGYSGSGLISGQYAQTSFQSSMQSSQQQPQQQIHQQQTFKSLGQIAGQTINQPINQVISHTSISHSIGQSSINQPQQQSQQQMNQSIGQQINQVFPSQLMQHHSSHQQHQQQAHMQQPSQLNLTQNTQQQYVHSNVSQPYVQQQMGNLQTQQHFQFQPRLAPVSVVQQPNQPHSTIQHQYVQPAQNTSQSYHSQFLQQPVAHSQQQSSQSTQFQQLQSSTVQTMNPQQANVPASCSVSIPSPTTPTTTPTGGSAARIAPPLINKIRQKMASHSNKVLQTLKGTADESKDRRSTFAAQSSLTNEQLTAHLTEEEKQILQKVFQKEEEFHRETISQR